MFRGFFTEFGVMATTSEELDSLAQFARTRLATAEVEPSLDELFDLWRMENPSDADYAENVAAIAEAIRDYKGGDRGRPAGGLSQELLGALTFETYLRTMPDVGTDDDFARNEGATREVEPEA
jgi:hypothetical protein